MLACDIFILFSKEFLKTPKVMFVDIKIKIKENIYLHKKSKKYLICLFTCLIINVLTYKYVCYKVTDTASQAV